MGRIPIAPVLLQCLLGNGGQQRLVQGGAGPVRGWREVWGGGQAPRTDLLVLTTRLVRARTHSSGQAGQVGVLLKPEVSRSKAGHQGAGVNLPQSADLVHSWHSRCSPSAIFPCLSLRQYLGGQLPTFPGWTKVIQLIRDRRAFGGARWLSTGRRWHAGCQRCLPAARRDVVSWGGLFLLLSGAPNLNSAIAFQ